MLKILLPIILAAALSGCFISDTPLIGAGKAAFPYEKISYKEEDSDNVLTLVHQGDAYVSTSEAEDAKVEIRFMPIADGLYLAEVQGGDDKDKPMFLHAVVAVDADKKTARSYAAVTGDEDKPAPVGFHECGDDLCIDRLDAYLARARATIAAGNDPDAVYTIVEMK